MKILAVSDVPAQRFYEFYAPGRLDEFDLILACGDLRRTYLEFLVTMARCPLIYVLGNHDDEYLKEPPEGCLCAEDHVVVHQGVRILGLGGSYRYRDGACMFTESQMARRVRRAERQIRKHGGLDILLTHAPLRGLNDFDSLSHRGLLRRPAGQVPAQILHPRPHPPHLRPRHPPTRPLRPDHRDQRLRPLHHRILSVHKRAHKQRAGSHGSRRAAILFTGSSPDGFPRPAPSPAPPYRRRPPSPPGPPSAPAGR